MYLQNKDANSTVEIHVTAPWIALIRFCITECPHGEITVRIVDSSPTALVGFKRNIRFDKPDTVFPDIDKVK